jgi:tungstate transport system ATP-binding protein
MLEKAVISETDYSAELADGAGMVGETRDLVYRVGNTNLIDGIDLRMPPRTLTVVMGPNGAGKSVLLRLMHGLLTPKSGEVWWGGRPLDDELRRRQAMVFQRPVLLRRSVAANINFVLTLRGNATAQRAMALLDEVGLADRATQPARLLSGGELQRLALARAMALEPRVLFMDEPTASLDPAATAAIEAIVMRVHQRGTKIVLITHDLGQARRLADDVVFLNRGRLIEYTAANQFFDSPDSREASDYLAGRLILN